MEKRPANTESTSVSFQSWVLELADHVSRRFGGENRSSLVNKGVVKQIIFASKFKNALSLLQELTGKTVNTAKTEQITVKIPSDFLEILRSHCADTVCDFEGFFTLAAVKYLLMREASSEMFCNMVYKKITDTDTDTFKPFIS